METEITEVVTEARRMFRIYKITEKDKIEIKRLYKNGELDVVAIAAKYKVARSTIAHHLQRMNVYVYKKRPVVNRRFSGEFVRKEHEKTYAEYMEEDRLRGLKKKNVKNPLEWR